jgi:hypothetical protein
MAYTGTNAETVLIKQNELTFYLQAQQAFAGGAQSYKIGNRQLAYLDPAALQKLIDQLMLDIVMLQNGGRRRSFVVIPRDL